MFIKQSVSNLIEELNRVIGIKLEIGINSYLQPKTEDGLTLFIDPSGLSIEDEVRVDEFAEKGGLKVDEMWNDWGRYIAIFMNKI